MSKTTYKSGIYKKQGEYQSFYPSLLNSFSYNWTDSNITILLEEALVQLGELNAFSQLVPDIDFFLQMHIAKEATSSSKIEGTKTEIDEVFINEEDLSSERRDDRAEVINYIRALNWSIEELKNLPLSMRLIKGAHEVLLSGVRGKHKLPGEIRRSQNWIGGANLKSAYFIPPHPGDVPELLSDLEKFWHNEELNIPHLLKAGISHYQFETIHPFLDGNGRTGRLLIILYLINFGLLNKPALYLSAFFEEHRPAYYDALTYVRTQNNIDHWLKFFLDGVITTAKDSKNVLRGIIELRQTYEERIANGMGKIRQKLGRELLVKLFSKPAVNLNEIAQVLNVSFQTASNLSEDYLRIGLFKEKTGGERNRIFELWEYIDLFRNKQHDD
jgi:Fic family protein